MRRIAFGLMFAFCLAGSAAAQSFNCNLAKQEDEQAICADQSLKLLDEQMSESFFSIRDQLPPDGVEQLKAEQKKFLADRAFCKSNGDCIYNAYAARVDALCKLAKDYGATCPKPD